MTTSQGLARDLGRWQLLAITIGAVVGAAIYIRPAMIAQELRNPSSVMLVWTLAGVLSLGGALSYGQLALRWPDAGGEYVYLRRTIGEPGAFLFGWMRLTVGAAVGAAQATAAAGKSTGWNRQINSEEKVTAAREDHRQNRADDASDRSPRGGGQGRERS